MTHRLTKHYAGIPGNADPDLIKANADERTIEGYASVFNVLDSVGDIVMPGAFSESIKERFIDEEKIVMLWQHKADSPMARIADLSEDGKGLRFKSGPIIDTPEGDGWLKAIQQGLVKSMSFAADVVAFETFEDDELRGKLTGWAARFKSLRRLTKLKLYEISPVTFPANEAARILAVKSHVGWMPCVDSAPYFAVGDAVVAKGNEATIAAIDDEAGVVAIKRGDNTVELARFHDLAPLATKSVPVPDTTDDSTPETSEPIDGPDPAQLDQLDSLIKSFGTSVPDPRQEQLVKLIERFGDTVSA